MSTLEQTILDLTKRLAALECGGKTTTAPAKSKPEPMETEDDDDDEVDLFGSDDEEEVMCRRIFGIVRAVLKLITLILNLIHFGCCILICLEVIYSFGNEHFFPL